jgi:hypothetical protein
MRRVVICFTVNLSTQLLPTAPGAHEEAPGNSRWYWPPIGEPERFPPWRSVAWCSQCSPDSRSDQAALERPDVNTRIYLVDLLEPKRRDARDMRRSHAGAARETTARFCAL